MLLLAKIFWIFVSRLSLFTVSYTHAELKGLHKTKNQKDGYRQRNVRQFLQSA